LTIPACVQEYLILTPDLLVKSHEYTTVVASLKAAQALLLDLGWLRKFGTLGFVIDHEIVSADGDRRAR
jgi:hypothetical protein